MKKKITTFLSLMLMLGIQTQAQEFESATDAVKNMGVGWNLGNTLDANGTGISDVVQSETYWGQPVTKPELITMMKEAGFGAIRVPVTWYAHIDGDGNVDAAWMKRVHEVVDYVIKAGLYCVLNVHHDTGAHDNAWVIADNDNYEKTKARYENLWTQIANEFKDYDQHLLFEGYNEMLDKYNSWCFAGFQRPDGYNADEAASAYKGQNGYAQSFVDAVRATGGNNAQRNLVVNTYAAAWGGGNWNAHLTDVLTEFRAPTDAIVGHLAFEVHAYPTLSSGKNEVDELITKVNTNLAPNGPVIIGEWGTSNVDKNQTDYDLAPKAYLEFCKYLVEKAKENNIATFYWMGLSDGMYRTYPAFNQPAIAEAITKAYHGDNFDGKYPTYEAPEESVVFEGEKQLEWGQAINFSPSLFDGLSDVELEVTYTEKFDQFSGDEANSYLQFWYNDWSSMINFTADGQEISETLEVNKFYNSTSGTDHTTVFTFDAETLKVFKKKGMLFQGHGVLLKKAVLKVKAKEGGEEPSTSEVFWEGDEMLDWGDGLQLSIPAERFETYGKEVQLVLSYTMDYTDYDDMQLFYGDWDQNNKVVFTVDDKEYSRDFSPSSHYGIGTGNALTTAMSFKEDVYNLILQKGIVLQGHGMRLTKVELGMPASTAIQSVSKVANHNGAIYNLSGQHILSPRKGIYIKNGKKFVIK
ncbi:MAG: glycoside hydrolase family 5 protein [Prevotella sp.]|nr:glycoside hydrolase family 5 protein [Prevotella sp.]